jgi:hypothetical protein
MSKTENDTENDPEIVLLLRGPEAYLSETFFKYGEVRQKALIGGRKRRLQT